jgi:GNAT superfamily N-acetyltransferase
MTIPVDPERLSIRPATTSDLGTLLDFRLAMMSDISGREATPTARPQVNWADLRESNRRWLEEHFGRDFVAWIADLDGQPVASAAVLWFEHPPGQVCAVGREAYILNVYTRPEARRMGLARALMERAVTEARSAGAGRVWLRASDEGRPLYEAMGFGPGKYLQILLG